MIQKKNFLLKIIYISLFFGILSCSEKTKNVDHAKLETERFRLIDSVYLELGERNKSTVNWESFEYRYLYELQEYMSLKGNRFTFKDFSDFEIYKKDTTYMLSFVSNNFSNEIYFELSITKNLLNKYKGQNRKKYEIDNLVSISIDTLETISFEYRGEQDDYYSKVIVERNQSLLATGQVLDFDFYKKEKSNGERILRDEE